MHPRNSRKVGLIGLGSCLPPIIDCDSEFLKKFLVFRSESRVELELLADCIDYSVVDYVPRCEYAGVFVVWISCRPGICRVEFAVENSLYPCELLGRIEFAILLTHPISSIQAASF